MRTSSRLKVEHFTDSPYARELRSGLPHLNFEPELEAQYREAHLQRMHLRVRAWYSLGAVLAVVFTLAQILWTGMWSAPFLVHAMALVPCAWLLLYLVWSRHYDRLYLPLASIVMPLRGAMIAVFVAKSIIAGRYEMFAALTVYALGTFFFTGLLFRPALTTAAAIVIAFVSTVASLGLPPEVAFKTSLILVLTVAIGAFAHRDTEQSYRRNFLEDALIAELATKDGLSGLMNRKAFYEHLLRVWQQAQRDHRSIALLMIDIDHFKNYNDSYGHQAGDTALCAVAQELRGFAQRPLDLAARYGGEEFAVILYDLALPHVRDTAERLRQAVQNTVLPSPGRVGGEHVTVSVGVALVTPKLGRTPRGAVQLADEALYEAKQSGRNRVLIRGEAEYGLLTTGSFKSPLTGASVRRFTE